MDVVDYVSLKIGLVSACPSGYGKILYSVCSGYKASQNCSFELILILCLLLGFSYITRPRDNDKKIHVSQYIKYHNTQKNIILFDRKLIKIIRLYINQFKFHIPVHVVCFNNISVTLSMLLRICLGNLYNLQLISNSDIYILSVFGIPFHNLSFFNL